MKFDGSLPGRLALTPENEDERELLQATREMEGSPLLYWGDVEHEGRGWTAFIINTLPGVNPSEEAMEHMSSVTS